MSNSRNTIVLGHLITNNRQLESGWGRLLDQCISCLELTLGCAAERRGDKDTLGYLPIKRLLKGLAGLSSLIYLCCLPLGTHYPETWQGVPLTFGHRPLNTSRVKTQYFLLAW